MPTECLTGQCAEHDEHEQVLVRLGSEMAGARISQIVGPHGCGKSTLAFALAQNVSHRFDDLHSIILRRNGYGFSPPLIEWNFEPPFCQFVEATIGSSKTNLIIIDGIESIGPVQRRLLINQYVKQNFTVLLTTHRRLMGIKTLLRLRPDLTQFMSIVKNLQSNTDRLLSLEVAEQSFHKHRSNYRDAMWSLYDHWEAQCQCSRSAVQQETR